MSVKFGGIDLNSDAVSGEASGDVNGIELVESTIRIGNSTACNTLMEPPYSDQIRIGEGGSSLDFMVDKIRVSGEAVVEESMVGNTGEVEMESREDGKALNASVSVDNKAAAGVGIDLGLKDDGSLLGFDSVDSNVQGRLMIDDEKEEKGVVYQDTKIEDNFNTISLVVDLNVSHVANGERKSDTKIGYGVTEVKKLSSDPGTSFLDGLLENSANHINVFENGNQDATYIEQGKGIKRFVYKNKGSKNVAAFKQDSRSHTDNEGEYYVSDLIWGKVKSHPWWPGQIYDPSASSVKALKYKKKDCFLIAYFGDQTFAWNDASHIKPFRMHFSQMENQSNMDSFTHALNCALEEVSRRVEYGLACKCLSDKVYAKFKTQVIVNAGIRKESSVRVGGDNFSTAHSFVTAKLVHYLKELAKAPFDVTDRLDFVTARAQLLSFYRWKGYSQLPTFRMFDGLLETDDDVLVFAKEGVPNESIDNAVLASKGQNLSGKGRSIVQDSSSQKHKRLSGDGVCPRKKEKCMSELMSESCSNGGNILKEKAERKLNSSSSSKKRNVVDLISTDSSGKSRKSHLSPVTANKIPSLPEKLFKVGDRICRVANQLSGSARNTKNDDNTSQDEKGVSLGGVSHCVSGSSSEKALNVHIPIEHLPADEMLSQLSLVARDPVKDCNLISTVGFFSDFRNSVCLEKKSNSGKSNQLTSETSDKNTRKSPSNVDAIKTFGFEGVADSHWTDRIIQGNSEDQVLFEPESENEMPTVEGEAPFNASPKSDYIHEPYVVNFESQAEKTAGHADEKVKDFTPTVLILNFTDLESVPSEANLNKIFSRYGPLHESDTEVLKKSKRAKVVFKRRSAAETAFSSAGKFSIFGPSLVSYRLNYSPSPRKPFIPGTKRKRKDSKSVEGNQL